MKRLLVLVSLLLITGEVAAQHAHHSMQMDGAGMVMNANRDTLPRGCTSISTDISVTVAAGTAYAADIPGRLFGFSQHELRVPTCARVTVTFVNEDEVRHQWMVHGLPTYLYPTGMFHIEAMGGQTLSGTFIVPADDKTYLIHCDMAQHMEKGLKGQLVVGSGSGDLWSVSGVSDEFYRDAYLPEYIGLWMLMTAVATLVFCLWLFRDSRSR
jgi:plastocyanin